MTTRIAGLLSALASMLVFGAAPADASLSDEVNAGQRIAAHVDAGTATCTTFREFP